MNHAVSAAEPDVWVRRKKIYKNYFAENPPLVHHHTSKNHNTNKTFKQMYLMQVRQQLAGAEKVGIDPNR